MTAMLIDALTEQGPEHLDLFGAPPPPPSATARHAAIALRCAGTVNRIASIAYGEKPSRPDAHGGGAGIRWDCTRDGITVTTSGNRWTFTWRALDAALAASLTPGVCSAIAAWVARWRSMHEGRSYIDQINGHDIYLWPTYVYVTSLARAIEHDVQTAAVKRLVPS